MVDRLLPPDSDRLTFICGLGWPEVSRYYLSRPREGMWEFWEQAPGASRARMVFAWLPKEGHSESQAAARLLADYLGAFKAAAQPPGEPVQGLLSLKEIQRVLRKHSDDGGSGILRFPLPSPSDDFSAA